MHIKPYNERLASLRWYFQLCYNGICSERKSFQRFGPLSAYLSISLRDQLPSLKLLIFVNLIIVDKKMGLKEKWNERDKSDQSHFFYFKNIWIFKKSSDIWIIQFIEHHRHYIRLRAVMIKDNCSSDNLYNNSNWIYL